MLCELYSNGSNCFLGEGAARQYAMSRMVAECDGNTRSAVGRLAPEETPWLLPVRSRHACESFHAFHEAGTAPSAHWLRRGLRRLIRLPLPAA